MSDRLLHEKLREWASNRPFRFNEAWEEFGVAGNDNMLAAFADEIERQYVPVPRFPDGEPVHEGSETRHGTVSCIDVEVSDGGWGNWVIHMDDGNCIEGTFSQRVERPAPKLFDADGVEIKAGDYVWVKSKEYAPWSVRGQVVRVGSENVHVDFENGHIGALCKADYLTHKEPDSLEKLRDDMREAMATSPDAMFMDSRWVDRLTALIERGA